MDLLMSAEAVESNNEDTINGLTMLAGEGLLDGPERPEEILGV